MNVKFINSTNVSYSHLKNIVSNDDLRPVMCHVFIDFKNKCLVATDGHVLVSYPIDVTENDSDLDGVMVPLNYFNRLRYMVQLQPKMLKEIEVEYVLTKEYAEIHWLGEIIYRCRYFEGSYPKWKNVMPNTKDYPTKPECVGVNAHMLKKMIAGIPSADPQTLRMETTSKSTAILFTTANADYDRPIEAIIMPAMLNK